MIDIGYGNRTKHDIYRLIKRTDNQELRDYELEKGTKFKAEDFIDYQTDSMDLNGVSHIDRDTLTIETAAMLDFQNDDIVYDVKYDIKWRIVNVQIADDGQMKEYSLRPRKLTRLSLTK